MIENAKNYPISQLLDVDLNLIYIIPKYQREYSWTKKQWSVLFDDLLENNEGYFLGSIICINQNTDALQTNKLELVDGQQRMATLSILLAAIYCILKEHRNLLTEDQQIELINIKHRLILKRNPSQYRLVLQIQNSNQSDYFSKLAAIGIGEFSNQQSNAGNRRIYLSFSFFYKQLYSLTEGGTKIGKIIKFYEKVLSSIIVKIDVKSHADAYTLFESLNNRGLPLTPIDMIKNKLFSTLEKVNIANVIDVYFHKWNEIITLLGDDSLNQERFLRQYYNAFKNELSEIYKVPIAKKSNLIEIYQRLIDNNPKTFVEKLLIAARIYSYFLDPESIPEGKTFAKPLFDLSRIQGSPSYILLLKLFRDQDLVGLSDDQLSKVINILVAFFVRRNITDNPSTRDLNQLFMRIVDDVTGSTESVVETILNTLKSVSSPDESFIESLRGPIYADNSGATRFILCAVEEASMTKETMKDLWQRNKKDYIWTIEHIFPQDPSITEAWVQTIADGDRPKAVNIHQTHLHKLGNLTLSAYNANLGRLSLEEKRDKRDGEGRFIGYRNGLYLNEDLKDIQSWKAEDIDQRTDRLITAVTSLFSFSRYEL
jgi:uncharacterized protein with ParB-like and HNH nuclease domain